MFRPFFCWLHLARSFVQYDVPPAQLAKWLGCLHALGA